jgi:hypothetical protein
VVVGLYADVRSSLPKTLPRSKLAVDVMSNAGNGSLQLSSLPTSLQTAVCRVASGSGGKDGGGYDWRCAHLCTGGADCKSAAEVGITAADLSDSL